LETCPPFREPLQRWVRVTAEDTDGTETDTDTDTD